MGKSGKKRVPLLFYRKIAVPVLVLNAVLFSAFGAAAFAAVKIKSDGDNARYMENCGAVSVEIIGDYMRSKYTWLGLITDSPALPGFFAQTRGISNADGVKDASGWQAVQKALDEACIDADIVSSWVVSESTGVLTANGGRSMDADVFNLHSQYWRRQVLFGGKSGEYFNTVLAPDMFGGGREVVTVVTAVHDGDGTLEGYCGLEVSLDGLAPALGKYSLGDDYAVIAASGYGEVFSYGAHDLNRITFASLVQQAEGFRGELASYHGDRRTMNFYGDAVAVNGWTILVLFDESINSFLPEGLTVPLFISFILFLCLVTAVTSGMLRGKTKILARIENAVAKIADGGDYTEINTENAGVFYDLARGVNLIGDGLRQKTELVESYKNNDALTDLPNRLKLYSELDTLIAKSAANGSRFALMFIDLDNFKWLNETLGHSFGDAVLRAFAAELKNCLTNEGAPYRFSGDEFIILAEFGDNKDKVTAIVKKLQAAFANPLDVKTDSMTDSIYVRFSIGVSIYPDDDVTADVLLRNADAALHRAKESGKDRLAYYQNTLHAVTRTVSKAAISKRLPYALKNNELFVHYQPIISTDSGDIHGFEALLRWDCPDYGVIPTTEFIDVAEETGEIVPIGTWIFERACRFLKELNDSYRKDLSISINVSPVQLKRADYMEHIKRVMDIMQIEPANIHIEITENIIVDFEEQDIDIIGQIDKMGIAIALDDFGTGYSSMNYLKNYPIKYLKIDKTFIDEISTKERDSALTESIIDLVHGLGIKTIAEGIETVGQYDFLTKMRCDYMQGFLMSKPLDEDAAFEFVKMYEQMHKPNKSMLTIHEKKLADERELEERGKEHSGKKANGGYPENIIISQN